jgi:hypothetical protein
MLNTMKVMRVVARIPNVASPGTSFGKIRDSGLSFICFSVCGRARRNYVCKWTKSKKPTLSEANSCWASQEILGIWCNPKHHYLVHRSPLMISILSHGNQFRTLPTSLLKIHFNIILPYTPRSRHSVVGIATGYRLDDRGAGIRVPVGSSIFSFPPRPDQVWCPPTLLSSDYQGQSSRGVKMTTHLQPVPRSIKRGTMHPFPRTPSWRSA